MLLARVAALPSSLVDRVALAAIALYRRHLSPRKGYCCAYRTHTGRHSCSGYASRLVHRRGAWALRAGLPRQFARCRQAFSALSAMTPEEREAQRRRRREADAKVRTRSRDTGCSPCDVIDPWDAMNACDGCDHGCTPGHCDAPCGHP
jgi:putative component of membrane protein insertase Oxa1/YidC/SpoIIIJ protein YidD